MRTKLLVVMRERPFRALAELRALEPAVQVAQPIVMPGDLIAFIEQPCFLGTLGIALGPGCQAARTRTRSALTSSERVSGVVTAESSHLANAVRCINLKRSFLLSEHASH